MGIDRIGSKGVGPAASGVTEPSAREVSKSSEAGEAFKVSKGCAVEPSATSLERVRAGEISVSQYLDQRVSEGTAHLDGKLSPEQLEFVKNSLREQLSTDPMLTDLVHAATGQLPPARD